MHRTLGLVLAALALVVTTVLAPAPVPASTPSAAAATSGITGTITSPGSGPFTAMARVVPVEQVAGWPAGGRVYRSDDETFTVSLPPGRYRVQFFGAPDYAHEWWGDAVTRGLSTEVLVTEGTFVTLDPVLERGGSINGTVPEAVGADGVDPVGRVEVWAADPSRPDGRELVETVTVDPTTGAFAATVLHTGTYLLRATTERTKLEGWHAVTTGVASSATTSQGATPVDVVAPDDVSGIEIRGLHQQGYLAGRLTRADGAGLSGASITVYPRDHAGVFGGVLHGVATVGGGRWAIQLPAGTYRIYVAGTIRDDVTTKPEYSHDATTLAGADDTTITVGTVTAVDEAVEPTSVVVSTPPRQRGTTQVGRTLSLVDGSYYPSTTQVGLQWLRNGRPIAGATGSSYRLRAVDAGRYVTVRATFTGAGYETTVRTIAPPGQDLVDRAFLHRVARPTFSGRLQVGQTLRSTPPRTSPTSTPSYQWRRGGRPIRGATHRTYTITRADIDGYLSLCVVSRRPGHGPVRWVVDRFDAVSPR
ncbi:hypothetical protein [Nocardioides rubriscoriae]|uniref:hypothetical protein n=1 Tax=Nocardioides rubriscoriae TaxID=642762 RepID=UPI0011E03578|nr:hypothetical protein [Nocardioides rubriscoriae]